MTTDPRIETAARAVDPEAWRESLPLHPDDRDRLQSTARRNATAALTAADKAATITTTEELEHLEFGTVIRDTCGDIAEKWSPVNAIRLWYSPGKLDGKANEAIALPARVIHWGQA